MANEKRLIWDEDAKRHLIALATGHHSEMLHIDMILNAILHHVPTVDAVEVVHGHWIWCGADRWNDAYACSVCGKMAMDDGNYCPNCGAKMDGDGNG